jgi:hypothetical protein
VVDIVPCCTEEERHLQANWDSDACKDEFSKYLTRQLLTTFIGFLRNGDIDTHIIRLYGDHGSENMPAGVVEGRLPVTQIGTLEININTTKYGDGNQTLSEAEVPFRKIKGLAHLEFDPLYPVDPGKSGYYLKLLNTTIGDWMHEHDVERKMGRIGNILLYLDGQLLRKYDFTDRAAVRALQLSSHSSS